MTNSQPISITLSPAQIDHIVRAAAEGSTPGFSPLISTTLIARARIAEDGAGGEADAEGEAGAEGETGAEGEAAAEGETEPTGQDTEPSPEASSDLRDSALRSDRALARREEFLGGVAEATQERSASNGRSAHVMESNDPRLSRSLLRGLSILTCFGPGREERGILELAGELGMSPSTTHRYVATLVELGLLERCPRSRKYRLASL